MNLNLSASLNVFRLLLQPSLCLPHATVSTFKDLPVPLDGAFKDRKKPPMIRAVVLDKDDCFAVPDGEEILGDYLVCKNLFLWSTSEPAGWCLGLSIFCLRPPHVALVGSNWWVSVGFRLLFVLSIASCSLLSGRAVSWPRVACGIGQDLVPRGLL